MPVETFLLNVMKRLPNGYFVCSVFTTVHVGVPQSDSKGKVETWKEVGESGKPKEEGIFGCK